MSKCVNIVLASQSRQRQDLLKMIGLKYSVIVSDVLEKSNYKRPDKYVMDLSMEKALSVKRQLHNKKSIILSFDTIIYCDGEKFEKPKSIDEAIEFMKLFSGRENYSYTGVTIIDMYNDKVINYAEKTKVKFKDISDEEVMWYINNEEKIFRCCGYVPLGKASIFIEKVDGDYNNLFGLPINSVFNNLLKLGYKLEDFEFER